VQHDRQKWQHPQEKIQQNLQEAKPDNNLSYYILLCNICHTAINEADEGKVFWEVTLYQPVASNISKDHNGLIFRI
jgi:hypothetical protein